MHDEPSMHAMVFIIYFPISGHRLLMFFGTLKNMNLFISLIFMARRGLSKRIFMADSSRNVLPIRFSLL